MKRHIDNHVRTHRVELTSKEVLSALLHTWPDTLGRADSHHSITFDEDSETFEISWEETVPAKENKE